MVAVVPLTSYLGGDLGIKPIHVGRKEENVPATDVQYA
jgi:hypothetical protein